LSDERRRMRLKEEGAEVGSTDAMKPDVNIAMLPAYDFPGL